jgi:hypothetical protein
LTDQGTWSPSPECSLPPDSCRAPPGATLMPSEISGDIGVYGYYDGSNTTVLVSGLFPVPKVYKKWKKPYYCDLAPNQTPMPGSTPISALPVPSPLQPPLFTQSVQSQIPPTPLSSPFS